MTARRLLLTSLAMAAIAAALTALAPTFTDMTEALADPQRTVDRAGPEHLVLAATGLLAWLSWGWGALGLALTAASAVPGFLGRLAATALHVVLPAGARRSAALLLGLGLVATGPFTGPASSSLPAAYAAAPQADPAVAVPDWPVGSASEGTDETVPDRPTGVVPDLPPAPQAGDHVVVRGDCLWSIAETRLAQALGREPTAGEVAAAVHAWWSANAAVLGPDPDLLLPGQVLRQPSVQ